MKKVLIVGVKGFIGSHLYDHFKDEGYRVFGADVMVDYAARDYFLVDATNSDFHDIFEQESFDLCVNCSGAASVPASMKSPQRDYHLNTVNVFRLLAAIRDHCRDCRFLNLSSAAVYGNPPSLPVSEDAGAAPVSPYGYHKYMSEIVCREFHEFFDIPTCSLRIFSAFGEGLHKQLFWDLHQKALAGKKVELFGTGNETRDFIYIKDLVRLISLVAEKGDFEAGVMNAGNGKEVAIKDVVGTFYDNYPKTPDYTFSAGARAGDPSRWVADIAKIQSLGYKPAYSLEEGLKRYYQWLQ